jgi:hypothetical protein
MNRFGTSGQAFPLSAGNDNNPTITPGEQTTFLCNTLPDRAPGGLAYYLNCISLTFKATLTQPVAGGSVVPWDRLAEIFIDNLNWYNCWHGTVVSPNFVKGRHYAVTEYIKGGFRYASRKRENIPATGGDYPINFTVYVYPSVSRIGSMLHDTAQLAALFKNSSLEISAASETVLSAISTEASLSDITCKASALMTPRAELVLGTPIETVLHQIASGGPGGTQVNITGFGRNSQLQGVQAKAGVVSLLELTVHNGQNGVLLDPADVTNYSFPWRNQRQTSDIEGYVWDQYQAQQPASRVAVLPTPYAGGDAEGVGFPYTALHTNAADTAVLHDMYGWPLVFPGEDCRLTDLQTADNDQEYTLTTDFIAPGNHQILAEYAKPWTEAATQSWVQLVTQNGPSSLAAHVLGSMDAVSKASLQQRLPTNKHVTPPDQLAYLPFQFING